MLNNAVNRVANGLRLAARRIVMNTPASIPVQVWRKDVLYINDKNKKQPADGLSFEALATSSQDEPNYEYAFKGYAYVLLDKFNGGIIHKNYSMDIGNDPVFTAQIEPYNDELESQSEQIMNIPEWYIKDGDILAMMIYKDFLVWFEVVGMTGQSIMADFGTKYILNKRYDLQLEPIMVSNKMKSCSLSLYRGDDKTITMRFTCNQQPFNVDSGKFLMNIVPSDGEKIVLSSDDGTITASGNVIALHFTHEMSQNWNWYNAVYDLQYTKDDIVKTLVRGQFTLIHDITR